MLVENPLPVGEVIKMFEGYVRDGENVKKKEWTVVKNYPHHVMCIDSKGVRQCFTNAELMLHGYVKKRGGNRIVLEEDDDRLGNHTDYSSRKQPNRG